MRWRSPPLLLLPLCLLLGGGGQSSAFKICAFNVQSLNGTKAANHRIMSTLKRVVARCDVCLLQEVKDPQNLVIKGLVESLNRISSSFDDNFHYQFVSSQSLGNSADNMQQYVYLYRKETVKLTAQHQYQKKQSFVREPFCVRFQSNKTTVKDFALVALHTEPRQAVQEMDRLYDVFQEVSGKWNTKNVMFLGDFHAGCAHMTRADRKRIRLFTKSGFYWLIGNEVDTTASDLTDCAYDRIVVHGRPFLKGVEPLSAQVFNIAKQFRLPMQEVLKMSDHFPVEVELKSSARWLQATPLPLLLCLSVILSPGLIPLPVRWL